MNLIFCQFKPRMTIPKPIHTLFHAAVPPHLFDSWEQESWQRHLPINIHHFRPESSPHRPLTQARLCYTSDGIAGIFKVKDRYVIRRCSRFQEPVYKDSCVEIFLKPTPSEGYFNFEFNCGGALLASYITDPTRISGGFKAFRPLADEEGRKIGVHAFHPPPLNVEIPSAMTWQLSFFIPYEVMESFVGPLKISTGTSLSANLYKCADASSHPHWAAWAPVDHLNFHLPHCFGTLRFA